MKSIICDTNIWYSIGSGKIPLQSFEGCTLFATYLNIFELSTSPKLLEKPQSVENALKAIYQGALEGYVKIIPYTPIEYIGHLDGSISINKTSDNFRNEVLGFGNLIGTSIKTIAELETEEILRMIELRKSPLTDLSNDINPNILPNYLFLELNNLIKTGKFRKMDVREAVKAEIKDILLSNPINHAISENFKWNIVELFISVYESFFKEKILNQELIKDNDWFDLFNLVYVKPNMLYWTLEGRWKENPNGFIYKANMAKYLFQ